MTPLWTLYFILFIKICFSITCSNPDETGICVIDCIGDRVCGEAILCISPYHCEITCDGNSACRGITITCGTGSCNLTCSTSQSCRNVDFHTELNPSQATCIGDCDDVTITHTAPPTITPSPSTTTTTSTPTTSIAPTTKTTDSSTSTLSSTVSTTKLVVTHDGHTPPESHVSSTTTTTSQHASFEGGFVNESQVGDGITNGRTFMMFVAILAVSTVVVCIAVSIVILVINKRKQTQREDEGKEGEIAKPESIELQSSTKLDVPRTKVFNIPSHESEDYLIGQSIDSTPMGDNDDYLMESPQDEEMDEMDDIENTMHNSMRMEHVAEMMSTPGHHDKVVLYVDDDMDIVEVIDKRKETAGGGGEKEENQEIVNTLGLVMEDGLEEEANCFVD